MFIPYRTTTPLYYFPWCTIALIVMNIAVYFYFSNSVSPIGHFDPSALELFLSLVLSFGDGLHPLQWLGCNFIHLSLEHLLGNMVFLWVFGQIVEGRMGWWKFLATYLVIGVVQAAGLQILFLGSEPSGAAGASSVIYGLIVMSLLFAPRFKIYVFYWILLVVGSFPISTRLLSVIYLAIDLMRASVEFGSATLHLVGAAVGLVVGIVLLKKNLVDCDGEDWFSLRRDRIEREGGGEEEWETVDDEHGWEPVEDDDWSIDVDDSDDGLLIAELHQTEAAEATLRTHLANGEFVLASEIYALHRDSDDPIRLSDEELSSLIANLVKAGALGAARPLVEESINLGTHRANAMKILLTKILIVEFGDRIEARSVLDSLGGKLSDSESRAARVLRAKLDT